MTTWPRFYTGCPSLGLGTGTAWPVCSGTEKHLMRSVAVCSTGKRGEQLPFKSRASNTRQNPNSLSNLESRALLSVWNREMYKIYRATTSMVYALHFLATYCSTGKNLKLLSPLSIVTIGKVQYGYSPTMQPSQHHCSVWFICILHKQRAFSHLLTCNKM